jgi:integrase
MIDAIPINHCIFPLDVKRGIESMEIGRETYAIPYRDVAAAVQAMDPATDNRVMFIMLALTGCRIKALESMRYDRIFGNDFFYRPCKSQKGWIKEYLPDWYLRELREYRESRKIMGNAMFGISSETFRRYFNRDERPRLPEPWRKKIRVPWTHTLKTEYQHELKGLRKNLQTTLFAQELKKWGNPEIALQFTSKHMKHSSTRITAHHYICNFDGLGISPDLKNVPSTTLMMDGDQRRILEYQ